MLAGRGGGQAARMIPAWIRDLDGADPYELLEVTPSADRATIVASYRRLIRTAHPDLPTGDAKRARLLHLARDILLDPLKRADYDRFAEADDTQDTAEPDTLVERSIWDDDDITVGVAPPPPPPPKYHPYQAPPYYPPQYPPPYYPPRPPAPSTFGLGLAALIVGLFCSPAGLIMGIVALAGTPRSQADRVCAWVAVVLGASLLLICGLYFFVVLGVTATSTP